ncbi:MAG: nucleoside-diphosphate kinase [Acidobacteriota bacterium]
MAERTLTILKPDVMAKRVEGHVLQRLLDEGFEIVGLRLRRLSETEAAGFYAVHRERPFYPELVRFMTSGPVLVACLERDNAVAHLRAVMGPTDSGKAPRDTIRGRFGTDVQANAIHGSDSPDNAEKEIRFFFPGGKFE